MAVVIDASIAASWFLPDENSSATASVLESLATTQGVVPGLFWHEMSNVLTTNERRGKISRTRSQITLVRLRMLQLVRDDSQDHVFILELARKHGLSVYGRPQRCKHLLVGFGACGQVLSSIRPHDAAVSTPRACMEARGSGPIRLRGLQGPAFRSGFPNPVSLTFALTRPPTCPHPRRLPARRRSLRRWREPGNSPSLSSAPR